MTINELCDRAHANAKQKGFYENGDRNFGEFIALVHSELSEALEAARDGQGDIVSNKTRSTIVGQPPKPEGVLIELADAIIRIADYCGSKGWDLEHAIKLKMIYNATRSHKHGKEF